MKETERSNTGRGEERRERESSQRPSSAFSAVIIRNLPGARASVGRTRTAQQHNNEQSCSNLFVVAPVVVRLNLNGQMSLLTRTERSVSFPMSLPTLNNSRYRTTSAIVSMPLLAGGRKKRTFIGTIVILNHHKKSVRKRSVKSRKQRQRHSPSRCMPRSFFILPPGHSFTHTHTHTVGLGRQRRNHPRAHKARAQMQYP